MHFRAVHGNVDTIAPFKGAPHTVALIKRYALESQRSPIVRLTAEEIVSGLDSKDYLSEIEAIYNFVIGHVRYANDPRTIELVRRPELVLREIVAGKTPSLDCDDMVTLELALYLSLGRRVRIITVAFNHAFFRGKRQFSHVFMQVQEPRSKAWINIDPVAAEETGKMLTKVKALKIWEVA